VSDCEHPLAQLEVDAGNAGARSQGGVFFLRCKACLTRHPGPHGVRVLVESMARDSVAMWAAVSALGGKRPAVAPPRQVLPAAECQHYLSWLKPEGGEVIRGATGNLSFRCVGCRASWPMAVGLGLYLARVNEERAALRAAILKLGGVIS